MTAPAPWDVPGRVQGIDISSCQPRLDFNKIAAAGVRFCVVKATEGEAGKDPRFTDHVEDARAAGLYVGSYHFLHSSERGKVQAEQYWERIEHARLDMAPCLDWEDHSRVSNIGAQRAFDCAYAFIERMRELSGDAQTVYTGPGFMAMFPASIDRSPLAGTSLWVAHYRWDPANGKDYGLTAPSVPKPWLRARAWQCGGNGAPRIPGIPVDIDRNVFFGDESEFLIWIGRMPEASTYRDVPTQPDTAPNDPYWVDRMAATLADDPDDPSEVVTMPGTPTSKSSQSLKAVNAPIAKDQ